MTAGVVKSGHSKASGQMVNQTTIHTRRISSGPWLGQITTAVDAAMAKHRTIDLIAAYEKVASMSPEELKDFTK